VVSWVAVDGFHGPTVVQRGSCIQPMFPIEPSAQAAPAFCRRAGVPGGGHEGGLLGELVEPRRGRPCVDGFSHLRGRNDPASRFFTAAVDVGFPSPLLAGSSPGQSIRGPRFPPAPVGCGQTLRRASFTPGAVATGSCAPPCGRTRSNTLGAPVELLPRRGVCRVLVERRAVATGPAPQLVLRESAPPPSPRSPPVSRAWFGRVMSTEVAGKSSGNVRTRAVGGR